ncbi:uncharacterized protein LOC109806192 [Cajanus cajan]|nr:uncharacterized protein LOC109806192 [Cajanus cajan]
MAEEGTDTHNGGHGPARPPRRTLGDYAQRHGPRHFSSIAAPNTSRALEMKSAFLTLVSSQKFTGLDHEDPYSHLSNFYELCGTMGIHEGDEEVVYLRLFPFSLTGKAKVWLQSHPNQSLTSWSDVENKFVNRFYPSSKYIKAKLEITTFRQGADEPFYEAWERFNSLLRKCPNHGFEDIAQINFFVNGIKPEVKMLLDAAAGGTMMSISPEEATQIIESLASSDHQAEHGRHQSHKRGVLDLSTSDAIRAQNKLLSQQIKTLTKQMAKIPQQLHAIASSPAQSNSSLKCDFCGGDHPNGHCFENSNEEEVNYVGNQLKGGSSKLNIPYPHAPSKKENERQFLRFLDIIKKLQINISFTEAMEKMPTYARFMKELLTKKRKILEEETVELEAGCSAIIQKSLPQKSRDPGSFTLPVSIGNLSMSKALLDLGASINLIPLSMLKKIGEVQVRPTRMTLQLADRSIKLPHGIVEDMIVKVDKFMFPVDFIVMDMEEDVEVPLILGRPFMKTARVIIDMDEGKLKVRVQDEEVSFNVFEAMKCPKGNKDCFRIDVLDDVYLEAQNDFKSSSPLEKALLISNEELDKVIDEEVQDVIDALNKRENSSANVQSKEELKKEEKEQVVKL